MKEDGPVTERLTDLAETVIKKIGLCRTLSFQATVGNPYCETLLDVHIKPHSIYIFHLYVGVTGS